MKKPDEDPDMLEEYDFTNGTRGKHAARVAEGTLMVQLDANVAAYFPDGESVNAALRHLVAVIDGHHSR